MYFPILTLSHEANTVADSSGSPEQLVARLSSNDGVERTHAREALVAAGESVVPALLPALESEHQHARWEAAKALTEIRSPAAAPKLVDCLADEDADVRWVAAEALIALDGAAIGPLCRKLIKGKDLEWLHDGAHHVVRELAKTGHRQVLEPLSQALASSTREESVPVAAEAVLEKLDG